MDCTLVPCLEWITRINSLSLPLKVLAQSRRHVGLRHSIAGCTQMQREPRKGHPNSASSPALLGESGTAWHEKCLLNFFWRTNVQSLCTARRMGTFREWQQVHGQLHGRTLGKQRAGDAGEIGWVLAKKGLKCWAKECGFFPLQVDTAWSPALIQGQALQSSQFGT